MVNRKHCRVLWGGLLGMAAVAAGYGLGRFEAQPAPRQFAFHVSGAPGMAVLGTLEVDQVPGTARKAPVPAQFTATGREVAFTVQHVDGPDEPIAVAVDIDGVPAGVGTAAGGVRVHVWGGDSEPHFVAVSSEPERKETTEAGPRPDLIGTQPPEWTPVEWINAERPRLADFRGQVVLVRWFTGPVCDDCVATAPALREFHERYRELGLAVVGMYHHSDATVEEVRTIVDGYGYRIPIGIDRGVKTRRLWCLGRSDYGYTSATFLLDRQGVIRYIHPGGRYVKGDADYQMLEFQIELWLAR